MSELAQEIKEAVESFYKAARSGGSNDDEHEAALEMAAILTGIATAHDPKVVIVDYMEDEDEPKHEDGWTYDVTLHAVPGMTLGPKDWRERPEYCLNALWENVQAWFTAAGDPSEFIDKVEVIAGEHFMYGPGDACDVSETFGLKDGEPAVVYVNPADVVGEE